jgi:hypothetical protein
MTKNNQKINVNEIIFKTIYYWSHNSCKNYDIIE